MREWVSEWVWVCEGGSVWQRVSEWVLKRVSECERGGEWAGERVRDDLIVFKDKYIGETQWIKLIGIHTSTTPRSNKSISLSFSKLHPCGARDPKSYPVGAMTCFKVWARPLPPNAEIKSANTFTPRLLPRRERQTESEMVSLVKITNLECLKHRFLCAQGRVGEWARFLVREG